MFTIKGLNQFFIFFVFILISNFCFAQSSELKGWTSVEYGFDINEILKINLSQHFRLKEDLNVIDKYITESDISFENVTLSYEGQKNSALREISLKVPHGKTTALVGPSGSGKSSILNLIPRFYDPDTGSVKIDNQDIKE